MTQKPLLQRFSKTLAKTSFALMIAFSIAAFATACAQGFQVQSVESKLVEDIQDTLTCSSARSQIFDAYYRAYQNKSESAKAGALTSLVALDDQLNFAPGTSNEVKNAVKNIHTLLTTQLERIPAHKASESSAESNEEPNDGADDETNDPLLKLIRLEMGSRIDPEYEQLNEQLDLLIEDAAGKAKLAKLDCNVVATPTPSPSATATPSPGTATRLPAALSGAHYTMATAYQSCKAVQLAPMTSSTASVEGVVRGAKVDSVGYGREYTDVAAIKKTHPYYKGQTYGTNCTDYTKTPLVYDYGGRPVVKSSTQISLFQDSGGGDALGIDCSAFVSSAVGVAGLRYKPSSDNKPVYTRYTSRDFISASKSGWTCYENVSVSKSSSIKSGDIVAVEGHVVMVDTVGSDPFGISAVTSSSGCDSLSYKNYDFAVIQSSPSKNSVGINRYKASVYLSESSKMQAVFLAYAKAQCKAKFSGATTNASASSYGIIRHKDTDQCKTTALNLVGESCIKSCSL